LAAVRPPLPSPPVPARWPETAQAPRADAVVEARRQDPEGDFDLADSLFETLYREGVDLPWP
jgi:hypothetical protein